MHSHSRFSWSDSPDCCKWRLKFSFRSLLTPTSWNMRCSLDVYSNPHACCKTKGENTQMNCMYLKALIKSWSYAEATLCISLQNASKSSTHTWLTNPCFMARHSNVLNKKLGKMCYITLQLPFPWVDSIQIFIRSPIHSHLPCLDVRLKTVKLTLNQSPNQSFILLSIRTLSFEIMLASASSLADMCCTNRLANILL